MMNMPRIGHLLAFRPRRTLPARAAYALWSETYPPRPHNPLMHVEQAIVAPMIAATPARRALDVGTGSGRYLPVLASTGARLVVGIDFSLPMLHRAFNDADASGTPGAANGAKPPAGVCGDACRLPFADASFDLVSSSLMVGDVANLAAWLDELARVLAPGGHLIYSDFHPSWATARWRRTFRTADGRSLELAYFPHDIEEHLALLADRSFEIRAIREPRLSDYDRSSLPGGARRRNLPVVVVFHAVKRSRRP